MIDLIVSDVTATTFMNIPICFRYPNTNSPPLPFIWDLIARPCAHDIAFKLNVVAAVME